MNKENNLPVSRNNVFNRIVDFIKSLFHKTQKNKDGYFEIKESKDSISDLKQDRGFIQEIKYRQPEKYSDLENMGIYRIQELYESNNISLEELSDEKVDELNALYLKQIDVLKEKIKRQEANQSAG